MGREDNEFSSPESVWISNRVCDTWRCSTQPVTWAGASAGLRSANSKNVCLLDSMYSPNRLLLSTFPATLPIHRSSHVLRPVIGHARAVTWPHSLHVTSLTAAFACVGALLTAIWVYVDCYRCAHMVCIFSLLTSHFIRSLYFSPLLRLFPESVLPRTIWPRSGLFALSPMCLPSLQPFGRLSFGALYFSTETHRSPEP